MARKIIYRENGLANQPSAPQGFRYVGYYGSEFSEKFGITISTIGGGGINLYNTDDSLTGNRIVTGGSYSLTFTGTLKTVSPSTSALDVAFSVRNSTDTDHLMRVRGDGDVYFNGANVNLQRIQSLFFASQCRIDIGSGIEYFSRGEIGIAYTSHNFDTTTPLTATGSHLMKVSNGGSLKMSIDKDGRVGINSSSLSLTRMYVLANNGEYAGYFDANDSIAGYFNSVSDRGIYAISNSSIGIQGINIDGSQYGIVALGKFDGTGKALIASGEVKFISPTSSSLGTAFSIRNNTDTTNHFHMTGDGQWAFGNVTVAFGYWGSFRVNTDVDTNGIYLDSTGSAQGTTYMSNQSNFNNHYASINFKTIGYAANMELSPDGANGFFALVGRSGASGSISSIGFNAIVNNYVGFTGGTAVKGTGLTSDSVGVHASATDGVTTDAGYAAKLEGRTLFKSYSKSALPSVTNQANHSGVIVVTDATGSSAYTICISDGINWIDTNTGIAVV